MSIVYTVEEFVSALSSIDGRAVVGYARVSTEDKQQQSSIERQIAVLEGARCQIVVVEQQSGTSAHNRSLYQAIINKIERIKCIKATRGDRLARDAAEMKFFYYLCEDKNVDAVFTDEPELNSGSMFNESQRSQKAYYAELESINIGYRVKKAYINAEANLEVPNRKAPFGYRIVNKKFKLDKLNADLSNCVGYLDGKPLATYDLARKLIELYLEIQSQYSTVNRYKREIIERLERVENTKVRDRESSRSDRGGLTRWLSNPILRGHLVYGKRKVERYGHKLEKKRWVDNDRSLWRIYEHCHEPLLSESEAKSVDRLLQINQNIGYAIANSKLKPGEAQSLSPILKCMQCGSSFISHSQKYNGRRYRYYRCNQKRAVCNQTKRVSERKLKTMLIEAIIQKSRQLTSILMDADCGLVTPDEERLQLLRNESEDSYFRYTRTGLEVYLTAHQTLKQEIAKIEANVARHDVDTHDLFLLQRALAQPEFWQSMNDYDLHRYLREIVSACWMENQAIVRLDLNL